MYPKNYTRDARSRLIGRLDFLTTTMTRTKVAVSRTPGTFSLPAIVVRFKTPGQADTARTVLNALRYYLQTVPSAAISVVEVQEIPERFAHDEITHLISSIVTRKLAGEELSLNVAAGSAPVAVTPSMFDGLERADVFHAGDAEQVILCLLPGERLRVTARTVEGTGAEHARFAVAHNVVAYPVGEGDGDTYELHCKEGIRPFDEVVLEATQKFIRDLSEIPMSPSADGVGGGSHERIRVRIPGVSYGFAELFQQILSVGGRVATTPGYDISGHSGVCTFDLIVPAGTSIDEVLMAARRDAVNTIQDFVKLFVASWAELDAEAPRDAAPDAIADASALSTMGRLPPTCLRGCPIYWGKCVQAMTDPALFEEMRTGLSCAHCRVAITTRAQPVFDDA